MRSTSLTPSHLAVSLSLIFALKRKRNAFLPPATGRLSLSQSPSPPPCFPPISPAAGSLARRPVCSARSCLLCTCFPLCASPCFPNIAGPIKFWQRTVAEKVFLSCRCCAPIPVFQHLSRSRHVDAWRIVRIYQELVSQPTARHTNPCNLDGGSVDHGTYRVHEYHFSL